MIGNRRYRGNEFGVRSGLCGASILYGCFDWRLGGSGGGWFYGRRVLVEHCAKHTGRYFRLLQPDQVVGIEYEGGL